MGPLRLVETIIILMLYASQNPVFAGADLAITPAECSESHNSTVICSSSYKGDQPNTTVCLNIYDMFIGETLVNSNCGNGAARYELDLDIFIDDLFLLETTVKNQSGEVEGPSVQLRLVDKVIPNPPEEMMMVATGVGTFNISFKIPPYWDSKSKLKYSFEYTQDGQSSPEISVDRSVRNHPVVPFELVVRKRPFSLVCMRIRTKYGKSGSPRWGNYSKQMCGRTLSGAPSVGPRALEARSERDGRNPQLRRVTLSWEPPPLESRHGIITHYTGELWVINDDQSTDQLINFTVDGNTTSYTLEDLSSSDNFTVSVTAWTEGGSSPEATERVPALPATVLDIYIALWIFVATASLAMVLVLLKVYLVVREKVRASHLPEPSYIHPSKVPTYRAFSPEGEIFDPLEKGPKLIPRGDPVISHTVVVDGSKPLVGRTRLYTSGDSGISCDDPIYTDGILDDEPGSPEVFLYENFDEVTGEVRSPETALEATETANSTCTYTGLPADVLEQGVYTSNIPEVGVSGGRRIPAKERRFTNNFEPEGADNNTCRLENMANECVIPPPPMFRTAEYVHMDGRDREQGAGVTDALLTENRPSDVGKPGYTPMVNRDSGDDPDETMAEC